MNSPSWGTIVIHVTVACDFIFAALHLRFDVMGFPHHQLKISSKPTHLPQPPVYFKRLHKALSSTTEKRMNQIFCVIDFCSILFLFYLLHVYYPYKNSLPSG